VRTRPVPALTLGAILKKIRMPEETNGHSASRLDRVERIVEILANTQADMQQDLRIVLRAQVVMGDALEKLTAKVIELAEAQRHTDARMDALILTVDEIIRGKKQQ
jgi:hypothetical protein